MYNEITRSSSFYNGIYNCLNNCLRRRFCGRKGEVQKFSSKKKNSETTLLEFLDEILLEPLFAFAVIACSTHSEDPRKGPTIPIELLVS